jgi:hypothetical protein
MAGRQSNLVYVFRLRLSFPMQNKVQPCTCRIPCKTKFSHGRSVHPFVIQKVASHIVIDILFSSSSLVLSVACGSFVELVVVCPASCQSRPSVRMFLRACYAGSQCQTSVPYERSRLLVCVFHECLSLNCVFVDGRKYEAPGGDVDPLPTALALASEDHRSLVALPHVIPFQSQPIMSLLFGAMLQVVRVIIATASPEIEDLKSVLIVCTV